MIATIGACVTNSVATFVARNILIWKTITGTSLGEALILVQATVVPGLTLSLFLATLVARISFEIVTIDYQYSVLTV